MKEMPAWKAYRLLEAGPIVLVTTAGKDHPQCHDHGLLDCARRAANTGQIGEACQGDHKHIVSLVAV